MNPTIISGKLDKLSELRGQAEVTRLRYQANIDEITAPIQAQVDALYAQVDALYATIQPHIDAIHMAQANELGEIDNEATGLEAEIKGAVKDLAETVKGQRLMAVYSKGRDSWDGKGLRGYIVAHPEVSAFLTIGEPSVALRTVNGK